MVKHHIHNIFTLEDYKEQLQKIKDADKKLDTGVSSTGRVLNQTSFVTNNISKNEEKSNTLNQQKAEVRKPYEGLDKWMKAPNVEPANLTEDQWVTVRTPVFKNWFGNWEYIANAYPKGRASERKDVNEYIKSLKGKQLKSVEKNIIASFSHKGLGKVASDAAINKSKRNGFSMQEHLKAVLNIEKLFSNSIKTNEREDHNDSIKGIEHFSSLFMAENNEPALVTFTVKVTENAGRKIYSIELMELKKVEGKVQGEARKLHQATSTFDTLNISRIAEKINNCSKIVDENGEPLVVYHGSDADFDTFDRMSHLEVRRLKWFHT